MRIGNHETHPAADAFPLMDEDALAELALSIKAYGQWHPIILHEGLILDGRNRYMACLAGGVEPKFKEYDGPSDVASLAGYVAIHNLDRRDLTDGGRACAARRLNAFIRERVPRSTNQVGFRSFDVQDADHADEVIRGGSPELQDAVNRGLPLDVAERIAKLDKADQSRAIDLAVKRMERAVEKTTEEVSRHMVVTFELTSADVAALEALCHYGDQSKHGIVKAGVMLVRKMGALT